MIFSDFQRICIIVIFSDFFLLNRAMFCHKELKEKYIHETFLSPVMTKRKTIVQPITFIYMYAKKELKKI